MELKDEIRNARQGKRMTQKELGEKVYLSPAEISHYEHGRRVPSDYNLELLEKVLGTKLGEKLASSLAEPGEETGKSRFRRLEDMKSPETISPFPPYT